jgi:hypothetical protein
LPAGERENAAPENGDVPNEEPAHFSGRPYEPCIFANLGLLPLTEPLGSPKWKIWLLKQDSNL